MIIYLSARSSRIAELKDVRKQLQDAGHTVNSSWLDAPPLTDETTDDELQKLAMDEWDEVQAADAIISFTEQPSPPPRRGARHAEFGAGLTKPDAISIVIGPREGVYHHLPALLVFDTWEAAKDEIAPAPETKKGKGKKR